MRALGIADWFQLFSSAAILLGLGLVIYELNQNTNLAHAQMAENSVARTTARFTALLGENPQEVLARASFHPGDLTESDAVVLDAFYQEIVTSWIVLRATSEIAGVDRGWRPTVAYEAPRYFSSAPGRRWLDRYAAIADRLGVYGIEEIVAVAPSVLDDESLNYHRSMHELFTADE